MRVWSVSSLLPDQYRLVLIRQFGRQCELELLFEYDASSLGNAIRATGLSLEESLLLEVCTRSIDWNWMNV